MRRGSKSLYREAMSLLIDVGIHLRTEKITGLWRNNQIQKLDQDSGSMSVHFEKPENSVTESLKSFNAVQKRWPRLVLLSKRKSALLAAKSDDIMAKTPVSL